MSISDDIMGGASAAQNQEATGTQQFMQAMQHEAQTQFPEEQQYQGTIGQQGEQLTLGGPNAFGFSTGENQALVGGIQNAGAQATGNTEAASLLREQQASGGAQTMPSGAQEALNAQVAETGAQNTAAQLGQERLAGYQAGRENYQTGVNELSTAANLSNPTGYAGAANEAGNTAISAENAVQQANANSLTSRLIGAGIGIGTTAATGGINQAMGITSKGCYVAAAIFDGWDDSRTSTVREWLFTKFNQSWYGKLLVDLYVKYGEHISKSPFFVRLLTPLFYHILKIATKDLERQS